MRQTEPRDCGAAALAIVLPYSGKPITTADIAAANLGAASYREGTSPGGGRY